MCSLMAYECVCVGGPTLPGGGRVAPPAPAPPGDGNGYGGQAAGSPPAATNDGDGGPSGGYAPAQ